MRLDHDIAATPIAAAVLARLSRAVYGILTSLGSCGLFPEMVTGRKAGKVAYTADPIPRTAIATIRTKCAHRAPFADRRTAGAGMRGRQVGSWQE
jgi:hypothetical protein